MALRERLRAFVVFLLVSIAAVSLSSAVTLVYNEGDLVRLVPEAEDIDGDTIAFVYSSPLNQSGEWQTGYNDAGAYETTVSAFDGKDYTEEEVTLVINNVNRPPVIDVDDVEVVENELVDVQPDVRDPDNDDVAVIFSPPLDKDGRWQTSFEDAGTYNVTITAHDGEAEAEETFTITVENKNRAPSIITALPDARTLRINEAEEASFFAEALDPDGDSINYVWFIDREESGEGEEFTYVTNYESVGEHEITIEVSDGVDTVQHRWTVVVRNVNRAPSVQHLNDVTVDEGEQVALELPEEDADGEKITYTIDAPVGNDGEWQTGFDDAGIYTITVVASDGELSDRKTITLAVVDIDRAPEIAEIGDVTIKEDEELRVLLSAADPDGDELRFSSAGLEGAAIDDFELTWSVGYDFIQLPKHFFAQLLSRLRIDHFVYKPNRAMDVIVTACGKEKCSNQSFTVVVQNVNREPVLDPLESVTVREGDEVVLAPRASDPDNDYIRFSFSKPIGFWGKWKTDFDDTGEYSITVTASDGEVRVEQNVSVFVDNVNRVPEFGRFVDQIVRENETLSFEVPVSDADGDNLTLVAEDLPLGAEFSDGVFTWVPDYDTVVSEDGRKEFLVTFGVTDTVGLDSGTTDDINESNERDITTVKKSVIITAEHVNRAPVITNLTPNVSSIALVGQPVVFRVEASDPDGDALQYTWKFGFLDSVKGHPAVRRTFSSVGEKEVTVVVSDGKDEVEHTWDVKVGRLRRRAVQG